MMHPVAEYTSARVLCVELLRRSVDAGRADVGVVPLRMPTTFAVVVVALHRRHNALAELGVVEVLLFKKGCSVVVAPPTSWPPVAAWVCLLLALLFQHD